ncbi:predicted metal-binding, possibly nucleic acid-binding protein [Longilinea arvoryzae]|uniref:Predicted metal-binding, possibly nucleic acid-binding protein n=1 Tax=Longilinea arvoryzae TaxID=360412 RepID=A0A0S7BEE0_9CHLR|nr:DUF177 domain-containing protein [Longilinea arvoryzae]GAP12867.1 predicted metal-binding, possibly nucleic acid-binding protein [Longilinea arvoryzae]
MNLRYPLRFNVGFLINQPVGTYREIPFEFEQLDLWDDLPASEFSGTARVSKTGQGILVEGDFQTVSTVECVRCLTEFKQPIHAQFQELFAFRSDQATDSGLVLPENGNIDLAPLVREYLLLEVPIKPICRPDCRGLCLECGANLNETTCPHQAQVVED